MPQEGARNSYALLLAPGKECTFGADDRGKAFPVGALTTEIQNSTGNVGRE